MTKSKINDSVALRWQKVQQFVKEDCKCCYVSYIVPSLYETLRETAAGQLIMMLGKQHLPVNYNHFVYYVSWLKDMDHPWESIKRARMFPVWRYIQVSLCNTIPCRFARITTLDPRVFMLNASCITCSVSILKYLFEKMVFFSFFFVAFVCFAFFFVLCVYLFVLWVGWGCVCGCVCVRVWCFLVLFLFLFLFLCFVFVLFFFCFVLFCFCFCLFVCLFVLFFFFVLFCFVFVFFFVFSFFFGFKTMNDSKTSGLPLPLINTNTFAFLDTFCFWPRQIISFCICCLLT